MGIWAPALGLWGCGVVLFLRGYLSLNAVEASEPKDLPPAELSLSMVNFIHVVQLIQLLIWDFLLLCAVTSSLQELQPTRGDRGNDLNECVDGYQVATGGKKKSSVRQFSSLPLGGTALLVLRSLDWCKLQATRSRFL